jgi:lysophospholipase L1-like esterase
MPTPERTPGTSSSRLGLKVTGVLAAFIAVSVAALICVSGGVTLTTFAQASPDRSPIKVKAASAKAPTTPWPIQTTRSASAGISRSITVVGVGDSVTSGQNCSCATFVAMYASDLASTRGLNTSAVNLGVSGWTSVQLLQAMTKPGAFRDQLAKADVLLVTIGANDLLPLESKQPAGCPVTCYGPMLDSLGHNVTLIVAAARAAHPGHPSTILVTDYWNVFQDGDVGTSENGASFQSWSEALTRAASNSVCTAARQAGATCVGLYAPFKGNGSKNPTALLAADGDHPNAAGHQLIASTLLASTPQPLP